MSNEIRHLSFFLIYNYFNMIKRKKIKISTIFKKLSVFLYPINFEEDYLIKWIYIWYFYKYLFLKKNICFTLRK